MNVKTVTITENASGQRIDNFLITLLKNVPHSHIYRILRKGEVRVNKKRIKPLYKLEIGDEVRIPPLKLDVPETTRQPSARLRNLIKESIIYQDEQLLVLNKPAGLAVHAGSGVEFGVIETLRTLFPDEPFLELVHRIDRETSGCLMIARQRPMLLELQNLLKNSQINKYYLLCVHGRWPKEQEWLESAIQRRAAERGGRKMITAEAGRHAKTRISIERVFPKYTILQAKPLTGRTHQIRVHVADAGYPIIGDPRYGNREHDKRLGSMPRMFLHARTIDFVLPSTGKKYIFTAEIDEYFQAALHAGLG